MQAYKGGQGAHNGLVLLVYNTTKSYVKYEPRHLITSSHTTSRTGPLSPRTILAPELGPDKGTV